MINGIPVHAGVPAINMILKQDLHH
jgi:sugar phosphate isomerase/epimerase